MSQERPESSGSLPRRNAPADLLMPIAVLAVLLLTWQVVVMTFHVSPILFPGPLLILEAAWKIRWQLAEATFRTATAAASGLTLGTVAGTLTAFAFSQSAAVRRALYPYAVLLQTVPIIAIAPIVIVTMGMVF